jgi:polyisoprenoid-binding protein YceI
MKRSLLIAVLVGVAAVAVGGWYFFIRDDAPPELTLEDAVEGITSTTAPDVTTTQPSNPGASLPPTTTTPATDAGAPDAAIDGTWTVDQANTIVGYRIGEELSGIGTTEAVGRTSDVTGSLTLNGTVIESVTIEVDMTTLQSDSGSRDDQLRTRGLETDAFPAATFELTDAFDLGSLPADGATVSAVAAGELTLHGVTQSVEIPLEGTRAEGRIVVVGSLDVALADYDIEKPVGFRVLTIEDVGVFEVQLAFTR